MRIYEFTRYQTKIWALEELKKEYNRLGKNDKDRRETLLREIGDAYLKAPVMYDKANLLVHSEPVPDTHILPRGDSMQKGSVVKPGFPAVLGPAPQIVEPETPWFIPRRREALAKWIASRDNPLTARVMVNRIWQGHFGRGIVATPNDFGRQGDRPSNPELLDWLAVEFMENRLEREAPAPADHEFAVLPGAAGSRGAWMPNRFATACSAPRARSISRCTVRRW